MSFCDEVLDAIEPIADGELVPDGRIASHLATCANCTAALESARRVDRLLRSRPVPQPPAQFTSRTLARLRRQRWRSEQFLDAGFNTALVIIIVGIVAAVWMVMRRSGLIVVGTDAADLFGSAFTTLAQRVAPSLPLYAGATAAIAAVLALWWWAERDATL